MSKKKEVPTKVLNRSKSLFSKLCAFAKDTATAKRFVPIHKYQPILPDRQIYPSTPGF